jgi:hypothetical protein
VVINSFALSGLSYQTTGKATSQRSAVMVSDLIGNIVAKVSNELRPIGPQIITQNIGFLSSGAKLQDCTLVNPDYAAIFPDGMTNKDTAPWENSVVTGSTALFSKCYFGWRFPDPKKRRTNESKREKLVALGGGMMSDNTTLLFASLAGLGTAVASASFPRERRAEGVWSNTYHYSLSF